MINFLLLIDLILPNHVFLQDVFLLTDLEKPTTGVATPSMPVFYQYNWSSNSEDNSSILPETVLLKFQSRDKICAVVRVQEALCPVNDMEWNVKFEGTYQVGEIFYRFYAILAA